MEHDTDELLERALKLPAEARAALAGSLIDSLDETWAVEIARRLDDLRAGRVKLIPWSEARRRIAGC